MWRKPPALSPTPSGGQFSVTARTHTAKAKIPTCPNAVRRPTLRAQRAGSCRSHKVENACGSKGQVTMTCHVGLTKKPTSNVSLHQDSRACHMARVPSPFSRSTCKRLYTQNECNVIYLSIRINNIWSPFWLRFSEIESINLKIKCSGCCLYNIHKSVFNSSHWLPA